MRDDDVPRLTIWCYCGFEADPADWVWLTPDGPVSARLPELQDPALLAGAEWAVCPRCGRRLVFHRFEGQTGRAYCGPIPISPEDLADHDRIMGERWPGAERDAEGLEERTE